MRYNRHDRITLVNGTKLIVSEDINDIIVECYNSDSWKEVLSANQNDILVGLIMVEKKDITSREPLNWLDIK